MADLPPFLRRCTRFPRSPVEDREDDDDDDDDGCNPSRRHHRKWGRAFELSVSFEALLQTKDAAEILFEFLEKNYYCDEDNDEFEDLDETEDPGVLHESKIVWMSKDVVMFTLFAVLSHDHLEEYLDHGAAKVYSIDLNHDLHRIWIIQHPSLAVKHVPVESDRPSPVLADGMDVVLRLLARHKSVTSLKTVAQHDDVDDAEFPASLDALKAFVGEAQSARTLRLQSAGLSLEQWHVVTSNCNENVTIQIYYCEDGGERSSLQENLILNHCPAKLELSSLEWAPADKRQLLFTALESTASLDELNVFFNAQNKESIISCIDAITRNRHFRRLGLMFYFGCDQATFVHRVPFDLTLEEWERFCGALASHPTLQEVQVCCRDSSYSYFVSSSYCPSEEKDEILIRMICQNTVLCKFTIDPMILYNGYCFDRAVNPVLELNRFRRVAQVIKEESDPIRRQHRFTATLLSKQVRLRPANRFLLFQENVDLLEQVSSTSMEGKLLRDWYTTMRHLVSLGKTMQNNGIAIPTARRLEDEITSLLERKKRKRSPLIE